jgi:hypothetical protein
MKKMTIYFKDGETMDIDTTSEEMNLIDNINSFYDDLIVEKLNEYEFKLSGFQEEYQVLNLSTKQLYNKKEQDSVVMITIDLDDIEYNHILETIKKKENDSNN